MGYTHYWYHQDEIAADAWAKIRADVEKLIAASDVVLVREYTMPGTTPVINDDEIYFNGLEEDGHETFHFERVSSGPVYDDRGRFTFCKTARKPYDDVVVAILAVAGEHAPGVLKISSDGNESEWAEGLKWGSAVLGRTLTVPWKRQADIVPADAHAED